MRGTHRLHPGSPVTLAICGEIDMDTAGAIRRAAAYAVDRSLPTLCLDLSGVTFMDSSGLRALADARTVLEAAGAGLVLVDPPACVQRVLSLAGEDLLDLLRA